MQTHVYANGREVCSKAADGVSRAAFPDVCMSPPAPGVPVPYPNTAFARDLANGTKAVFICGTEVAQKDKSYFSTSTGDEPATFALAKGVSTGALKGKAYFVSWSMNVKAEGLNVARHLDLMTHNHASPGGNTPPHVYFDDPSEGAQRACADELKRIDKACQPKDHDDDEKNDKAAVLNSARKGFLAKLEARFKATTDKIKGKIFKKDGTNQWIEDHCAGLWLKPASIYNDEIAKLVAEIGNIKIDLVGMTDLVVKPLVDKIEQQILAKVKEEAIERGTKFAAREGERYVVGLGGAAFEGVGVVVTEGVATALNVYDWGSTALQGYQLSKEAYAAIGEIRDVAGDFKMAIAALDRALMNAREHPMAALADLMSVLAKLNPCTRARRCILVPFNQTGMPASLGGKGCCPGQTGHHLLPHEMTTGRCTGYTKGSAPTICVEGVNNSHGTHGMIHGLLKKQIDDYKNGFHLIGSRDTLSYDQARDMAIESVHLTFPESRCSTACLPARAARRLLQDQVHRAAPPRRRGDEQGSRDRRRPRDVQVEGIEEARC